MDKATGAICPLCGKANLCAVDQGKPIESCWCSQRKVSSALLEQLPAETRMKSCICQQCVETFLKNHP